MWISFIKTFKFHPCLRKGLTKEGGLSYTAVSSCCQQEHGQTETFEISKRGQCLLEHPVKILIKKPCKSNDQKWKE